MSYYMHNLEGLFCKTAKHWINRKNDSRKKHYMGRILLAQQEEGIWRGCSHRAFGPAGGEGRPAGRWQAGPLGYWIGRAPADPTGSRQGRAWSTEAFSLLVHEAEDAGGRRQSSSGIRRIWARGWSSGVLVEEADEDLIEQGDKAVVQAAPRPGGLKHYLETFLGVGPQAGVVDHLAQLAEPPWV